MKTKIEKLRASLRQAKERDLAKARERARKRMAKGAELSRLIRSADTRMKILAGSWVLDRAEKSEDFRTMMMRELDRFWLVRDDDRELFGFALLSEAEKARRDPETRKAARGDGEAADASASLSVGSASAPAAETAERETEAA